MTSSIRIGLKRESVSAWARAFLALAVLWPAAEAAAESMEPPISCQTGFATNGQLDPSLEFKQDPSLPAGAGWTKPRMLELGGLNGYEEYVCPRYQTISDPNAQAFNIGHDSGPFVFPDGNNLVFAYTQDTLRDTAGPPDTIFDPYISINCVGAHRSGQGGTGFDIHEARIENAPAPPSCVPPLTVANTSSPHWLAMASPVNFETRERYTTDPEYGLDEGAPGLSSKFLAPGYAMVFARYDR